MPRFTMSASMLALAAMAFGANASASEFRRAFPPVTPRRHMGQHPAPYVAPADAMSGTWTDYSGTMPFKGGPETSLLLTDGTVIIHDVCGEWYKLTPDSKGKYETGSFSATAPMPRGYGPFYFASEVLADGRVIVSGGEYNGQDGRCSGIHGWTNKGALYDPVADSWTTVPPPSGWRKIGDAPTVILANGSYMLADCCNKNQAIANISGTTVTWTKTGSGKADENSEEGWTLLPDGNVLTVDTHNCINNGASCTEIYDATAGTWSAGPNTATQLVDASVHEVGPAVLRPDGTVIYFGAQPNNNLYDTKKNTWVSAPSFPLSGYDCADAPAALLPSGNVLVQASRGVANIPSHFFEFATAHKGKPELVQVNDPKTAPVVSSYAGRFLELPTGQVLWTNTGAFLSVPNEVATYTPVGGPKSSWLPVISSMPSSVTRGGTGYAFSGTNFNGFSQGASFGDDAQMASNYPLVRITNTSTGDVCFGRSYNFSTMGVWTEGTTNAEFDVPPSCETGASTVQVITNGLASAAINITVG
jgi:hypothetical protein